MSEPQSAAHPHHDYEKVLPEGSGQVASFDLHEKTLLQKCQHYLHSNPAAVPLIVLVFSVAVFGVLLGSKFFSAFTLTLILQQVAIVGIVGAAIGGWISSGLFGGQGITGFNIWSLLIAIAGACLLLLIFGGIRRRRG